jgi:hypothetical protein
LKIGRTKVWAQMSPFNEMKKNLKTEMTFIFPPPSDVLKVIPHWTTKSLTFQSLLN